MDIRGLAYVRIEARDPSKWLDFGTGILGMMVAPGMPQEDNVYLKMDEYAYRLCIVPGDTDRFICAGWELPDAAALADAATELEAAGRHVRPGTADECADSIGIVE